MAGRFAKHNGATLTIERVRSKSSTTELRRFKPDFYNPYQKPVRSPNLRQYRPSGTFGKRIVEQASKTVAKRAPLALVGPLGDLLALGLIGWDLYLLLLELQNNANPVPPVGDPLDPNQDPTAPPPYDLGNPGWYTGQSTVVPPAGTNWVSTGGELRVYWNNPRLDYPNLGASWTAPGDIVTDLTPVAGNVDSISTFVPVHNTATNADAYWHTHSDWWIELGTDPGTTFIGHGTPLPMDLPIDWAEPDPNMKRDMFPDGINMHSEPMREPDTEPKGRRRFKIPNPTRPSERTRERKVKGSLQTILKALDIVSESSEFVGAFYDALPKDVRDRWDQKGRGLMDNAGQYGIDGVDWKLNALWHNWHKVDVEQAIKNVIANELQDKLLGLYQRSLPNNIGHVADFGSMELNKLITLFNDTIGLS